MKISIEIFRGASPETIDATVMNLFQDYEEITIIELDATYGCYIESIEALKEDIITYLKQNKRIPGMPASPQQMAKGKISIDYFANIPEDKLEDEIKKALSIANELIVIELDTTYKNTPESIELLKNDITFYFSVEEKYVIKSPKLQIEGRGVIKFLFILSLIFFVLSLFVIALGHHLLGISGVIQCGIYAGFFYHILSLGNVISEQEKRITQLESQINKYYKWQ